MELNGRVSSSGWESFVQDVFGGSFGLMLLGQFFFPFLGKNYSSVKKYAKNVFANSFSVEILLEAKF